MLDKGFSKAPKLVPRVRPRVKAVEEPKKILKVDDQTMPAVEEEVVKDFQQESEQTNSIKPSGNIITIPQVITPEVIVAPTVSDCPIIMKDLIKSKFRNGQLSKLEAIRRQMISEKRKGRLKEEIKAPEPEAAPEEDEIQAPRGPQVRLVNGEIVIDENSLMVAQEREKIDFQRVEEDANRYVSSASFRIRKKTGRVKWTQELTDQFYDGLSYFGTDFGLVALLFPGFSRNMIKLKYNHEERADGTRISQALMNRKVPGDDLKMQMKHNLTINLEKEEVTNTATKISRKSSKAKAREEDIPDNANQAEKADQTNQEPSTVETVQPTTTIVEKAFQETAQKSFEDAIDNIQALSSSFSKPVQGPKIAPRVSKRPPRKAKSGSIDEQ